MKGIMMSKTVRLTAAQALVRYLGAQMNEAGEPFIAGVWAIFGHGNVAGMGEALHTYRDVFPTWRGQNEQTMAHAAIAYAKAKKRTRAMAVLSPASSMLSMTSRRGSLRDMGEIRFSTTGKYSSIERISSGVSSAVA